MIISAQAAGIDIGSRSIEVVAISDGHVVHSAKLPTTFDPMGQCARLLGGVAPDRIVATGYGRKLFASHFGQDFPVRVVSEIQAHAAGARSLVPEARAVLDIGGQDTKVIALTAQGRVSAFEMNDRCAAGTGKFLEYMAVALQKPLEEFGSFALGATRRLRIGSMCTVFAETEATSLMACGEHPEDIAMALHRAIAERVGSMLGRVVKDGPVAFSGGVARNPCMVRLFGEILDAPPAVPADPDMVGALGAALLAMRDSHET